ncbi:hypothetical protein BS50DRAFT_198058 [Corynespora cassiicola Philippines]|uniref:Uncharacterized protein n=1 Tax=Corynespora cassiicola Philippines TaxID=1448308 RepID=A0A2T2N6Z7_CORCC|nr:hypothetical protein BS50DRAFT_198058 [Corynespora cassiicola Philippines]
MQRRGWVTRQSRISEACRIGAGGKVGREEGAEGAEAEGTLLDNCLPLRCFFMVAPSLLQVGSRWSPLVRPSYCRLSHRPRARTRRAHQPRRAHTPTRPLVDTPTISPREMLGGVSTLCTPPRPAVTENSIRTSPLGVRRRIYALPPPHRHGHGDPGGLDPTHRQSLTRRIGTRPRRAPQADVPSRYTDKPWRTSGGRH